MTATPYSNMKPKEHIKQIEPSTASKLRIPLRKTCLILGYITLFYTSVTSIALFGILVWMILDMGIDKMLSSGYLLGDILWAHILSIMIFVILLNIFATVLTIFCLVGIHKRRPHLMIWHIAFTAARMLMIVATLGYNLLAELNFIMLIIQLTDICISVCYILVFKAYMDQLSKEIANKTNGNCDQCGDIKKVPIV